MERSIWLDIKADWHDTSWYGFVKTKCNTGEMLSKYISEKNSLLIFCTFIWLFLFSEKVKISRENFFFMNSMNKIFFRQAKIIQ